MIEHSGPRLLPQHPYSWRRALWKAYVRFLESTNWPILVGPWHGEIGFEVLYWIPFLEELKTHQIAPERLIPISRGGAAVWYGTPQGFELYACRTPQEVRVERKMQVIRGGYQKQLTWSAFDRAVVQDVAARMNLKSYHTLHPAWMYHILAPAWTGVQGMMWLLKKTEFPFLPLVYPPEGLKLPDQYVAVKFYERETFPGTKPNIQLVNTVINQLADQTFVVILDSPHADEHINYPAPKHPNVFHLRDLYEGFTPETNLQIQSSVIGKALGFVGTYGGMAQLALRAGRPSVSFYSDWQGTAISHKHLSDLLAIQTHTPFHVIHLPEIPMLRSVLPDVMLQPRKAALLHQPTGSVDTSAVSVG